MQPTFSTWEKICAYDPAAALLRGFAWALDTVEPDKMSATTAARAITFCMCFFLLDDFWKVFHFNTTPKRRQKRGTVPNKKLKGDAPYRDIRPYLLFVSRVAPSSWRPGPRHWEPGPSTSFRARALCWVKALAFLAMTPSQRLGHTRPTFGANAKRLSFHQSGGRLGCLLLI